MGGLGFIERRFTNKAPLVSGLMLEFLLQSLIFLGSQICFSIISLGTVCNLGFLRFPNIGRTRMRTWS
uniref:Uncharacterized protein n=1 Tax=Nelumbo nucifera TaxID=4432 RepID=A0A822ZCV7_NELNU|nr:TPA_asm: hypothetical protein HUJ06_001202 [Nelumbo nucifera]